MDQHQATMFALQPFDGALSAMNGAIVDDPEDASGITVRWPGHDLVDQRVKRHDPVFGFATTEYPAVVNVQSGQVCPGTATLILVFDAHGRTSTTWPGRMLASPCLNTSFLIGGNDELIAPEGFTVPLALVEIENARGFEGEVGIAWEHPTSKLPGPDSILVQPTPQGAAADTCDQARLTDLSNQVASAPPGQRDAINGWQFACQRFNLNDEFWGKKFAVGRDESAPPNQRAAPQRTVFATSRPLRGDCADRRQSDRCSVLQQRAKSSLRGRLENTVTYICLRASQVRAVRWQTNGSHMGFSWASLVTSRAKHAKKCP